MSTHEDKACELLDMYRDGDYAAMEQAKAAMSSEDRAQVAAAMQEELLRRRRN